jgi:catechol 2,3-dioxygenase-like lactoylglutathione lyase family enzyme
MQAKIDLKSAVLGSALTAAVLLLVGAATPEQKPDSSGAPAEGAQTDRVTGIGGVFFKARDPKQMAAWYRDHLGIQSRGGYADFEWREKDDPDRIGHTAWALFPTNTTYFGSSTAPMMINYRVSHLDGLLAQLHRDGIEAETVQEQDYGRFTWITDPEGNRIELWEPKGE